METCLYFNRALNYVKREMNSVWEKVIPWSGSESRDHGKHWDWGHKEIGTVKQELGTEMCKLCKRWRAWHVHESCTGGVKDLTSKVVNRFSKHTWGKKGDFCPRWQKHRVLRMLSVTGVAFQPYFTLWNEVVEGVAEYSWIYAGVLDRYLYVLKPLGPHTHALL